MANNNNNNNNLNMSSNSKYCCDKESLRSLENLMNEFFHDSTTNDRKREIEQILNNFSKQNNCWEQCLSYLTETNNEFTQMYCLSVLENLISIKWLSLGPEKSALRQSIWKYLLTNHQLVPQYIRNKTGKLLVNIARIDWPHIYPEFMQNILDLLHSRNTMSLALMLLKTAIEELTVSRDDLCAQRKLELNKLLQSEMGRILLSLTNVMEVILDKHCNFLTATPPPSPTQSPQSESNTSFTKGDILCNAFELSLRRGLLRKIPDMDSESLQISSQVLLCLTQLFAFMPLTLYHQISNSMLAAIFVFATFGCNNSQVISYHKVNSVQLGILAMNCINEIMSKSSTTNETNEFIFNMFKNTFHLLQKLTKTNDINNDMDFSPLENLDEEYISKFTEFLRFFISGHLPRFEKMPTFPIMEFLSLVFQYTFKQTSCETFLSALEVWTIFIDYLSIKIKQEQDSKQVNLILNRYKEPIVSLLLHISRKIQFKYNQKALDELDNENIDDDFNTEFQHYLYTCVEIIAKIADIYPLETYEIVCQFHNENLQSIFGLELYIEKDGNNKQINLKLSQNDLCRLHCALRDLSTALKLVGRLADHFITENFNRWFPSTKLLIEKLIQALIFCNKNQFHKQEVLSSDFIDVCAQMMATIKAYCHWLQQYYTQDSSSNSDSVVMISAIIENCIEIICDNNITVITNKSHINTVLHSAIHSLYSITTTVRPVFILNMECVQNLFSRVCAFVKCDITSNGAQPNIIPSISAEDERLLCRSISNMLLLPWLTVNDSSQNWETRTLYHDMFIEAIVEPFKNAIKSQQMPTNGTVSDQSSNNSQLYCRSLTLLSDIVENHKDSPTRSKQLLFKSIQTIMEAFISLFPTYFTNPVIAENCLNLFTVVFDVLRIQISFQFVEKTIQLMLKLFSTNQMNGISSEPLSSKVIPKFMKMLTFIVQQPGSVFKSLLPGMISFAFDQICPTIVNFDCPQLKKSLYEFLFQLLLNNWKYFYPNNSILGNTFNSVNSEQKEVLENADAFINIMNIFAQSFLMSDITVFKQNLDALEILNTRLKLYQKQVFKQTMIKHFLCLFTQTLLDKSLNLLQDDISTTVYNMASVDFDIFFNTFIPQFLYNCEGLNDVQRNVLATKSFNPNEKDFPSFVNNLNIFLNDLRYYRLCNKY